MSNNTNYDDNQHFTVNNVPFGVVSTKAQPSTRRIATRIYGFVYIFSELIEHQLIDGIDEETKQALNQTTLNTFTALPKPIHLQLRKAIQDLFNATDSKLESLRHPISDVQMHMPVAVGDFTDFSCSQNHVLNAGEAIQGKRSLPPGFLHFPVGYTGRSSSIVVSNNDITRPLGQYRHESGNVIFGPTKQLDFELELGVIIGKPTQHGRPVSITDTDNHIFGLVLLNDWSARDIQGLEMSPLGPLNGKSFGTTISPWIITLDALRPFTHPPSNFDPSVKMAPYLSNVTKSNHYNINLEVDIIPCSPSPSSSSPAPRSTVCRGNFSTLYWPIASLVAHQTINGCPLRSGDILGTGTISGSEKGSYGCLLEATKGGKEIVKLDDGGERTYLDDGDGVRMTAWAGEMGKEDCVGFGECFGRVLGAVAI